MKRFEGKVVVVTGGCRNTGMEIVDLFLREGAKVFFCGSNDASVAEGVRALEGRGLSGFRALTCDVSRRADVEAMMDVIKREAGRLDVVVCGAAIKRPSRGNFRTLVACGFDLASAALLEYRRAHGLALFCQLDVTAPYAVAPNPYDGDAFHNW